MVMRFLRITEYLKWGYRMYQLPEYLTENQFNQEKLMKVLSSGELAKKVDNFNNLIISLDDVTEETDLTEHLLLIPTERRKNIPAQVETYYDMEVSEFTDSIAVEGEDEEVVTYDEIEEEVESQLQEEQLLQAQIDELSDKLDEEMSRNVRFREEAAQTYEAARSTIVSQRIIAGEGNTPSDFSQTFPFLPLTAEEKQAEYPQIEKFPFMGTS